MEAKLVRVRISRGSLYARSIPAKSRLLIVSGQGVLSLALYQDRMNRYRKFRFRGWVLRKTD